MTDMILIGFTGGIATVAADAAYYPIDTIKSRAMASNLKRNYIQQAQSISKLRGIQSQGIVSFTQGFTFFMTYEKTKSFLEKKNRKYLTANHLVSAAIGEMVSGLVKNPFEVIKNQIQVGLDKNIINTMKSIYKTFGFMGFYAGLKPIIMRDILYSMITFAIYEHLKDYHFKEKNGQISSTGAGVCGFISGASGAFLTNPLDVIKTRLMTQRQIEYQGQLDCGIKIIQEFGIRGLFRASHLRVFGIASTNIIYFIVYEKIKGFLLPKEESL